MLKESCCDMGWEVYSVCDCLQSFRTVIDGVHGSNIGKQCLCSANVGSCLFSSDVLLSCLKGHSVGHFIIGVDRAADDSSGHLPNIFLSSWEKSRIRTSESHWDTKSLSWPKANISTHIPWSFGEGQSQKVWSYYFDDSRLRLVNFVEKLGEIMNYTFCIGCLNNYSKILLGFLLIEKFRIFSNNNL